MKKKLLSAASCLVALSIFTGCASYRAAPLSVSTLATEVISESESDLIIKARAFNKSDCNRYLDRDVISKGYQPVQLYIQNNTDKNYSFSLSRINLSCATDEEVAEKVHTSTLGRVVGYSIGALFIWPFVIPAIIDGIKSSEANESLDNDFSAKVARDQVIYAHAHFNKILFVPVSDYQPNMMVTLVEEGSRKPTTLNVVVN